MTSWTQEEVDDVMQKINKKAQVDKDFRELVLNDPNAAVKKLAGKEIPDNFKVKVVESDPDYDATVVLPKFRSEELSEEELEQIAGGDCRGNVDTCIGIDVL